MNQLSTGVETHSSQWVGLEDWGVQPLVRRINIIAASVPN
jgi:hypothetical protein